MDKNLALELVRVTEAAALASARLMGRGDQTAADDAAVEAMRAAFDHVSIKGVVVIGEGELDEAPMLYIGEQVGMWGEGQPEMDIALDPLEGTALCAYGRSGALAVIAASKRGGLLHAPDMYMDKIAVGPAGAGMIDITLSPTENLHRVAEAQGVSVGDLTATILDRSRHEALIQEVRQAGARIKLITDGDVHAAIATSSPETGTDILFGVGGAPEGVLAAAALRCLGGDMQGRLVFRNAHEEARARSMGIEDPYRVLKLHDLAGGHVLFAATGVTNGDLLRGVRFVRGGAITHSLVMRSASGTIRHIESRHNFALKPNYSQRGIVQRSSRPQTLPSGREADQRPSDEVESL